MTMRRRISAIDAYVAAMVIAGVAVLGAAAWALPSTPRPRDWSVLAVLALVASRFPLRVPGRNAWFSISDIRKQRGRPSCPRRSPSAITRGENRLCGLAGETGRQGR